MMDLLGKLKRSDGMPFKVLARGDCTSRRSLHLNSDIFANGFNFIQSQKSPAILHIDASNGLSVSEEELRSISDVSKMPGSLSDFYIGQGDRRIIEEEDADLLVLDSYADMNFELWQNEDKGWKVWIHPKYLTDEASFFKRYRKIGRRTFEQSVSDMKDLIGLLKSRSPRAPVLFLNQQTEFYPKLKFREEFYSLGDRLEREVSGLYFGGIVPKDELMLADIGSCGPGLTLHFQGATYRKMLNCAFSKGMLNSYEKNIEYSSQAQEISVQKLEGYQAAAKDNKDGVVYPTSKISLKIESTSCVPTCPAKTKVEESLQNYLNFGDPSFQCRWTPVVIPIDDDISYEEWERTNKKKYNRVRMKVKSERAGYYVKQINLAQYVGDRFDINTSSAVRSGGALRGPLLRSVDEMGGFLSVKTQAAEPKCQNHWGISFGTFVTELGRMQGSVQVDERMLAYITLRRIGDICIYAMIMGHDDHIADGVVYHCHYHIVRWLMSKESPITHGVKYLMYGGIGNGGAGLWQWKRTAGFVPMNLTVI